ncbi:tripartite tricarboxylate transporter substrate binding protein [Neoroseomonas oryzicola]|uniref:Tripartite tricarboxylate transporter substrate binding protein n=1 Tax=Neoroseomonas oryzicola TaxID=535904 RepID=A0A9X9WHY2_9PROT|nr:tripartite tricarboxylate transporter substrate binding protein [Neoroseomonas oryzicola]MBR0659942.1 tripartite tricarboxylate transporter substrate binding protein [Neoroseomonas oryzicola]NKE16485.1 tripartite tricarboxylate transporter substrate binding protein [Neoroseomonas oryzicola]
MTDRRTAIALRRRAVLALPALALAAGARAQGARTVELIVPYPPGGGNDIGARALAPLLERELGMAVVVQNRPGAGSQIGMAQVARARPDGLTIAYGLWPQTTTLYLDPGRQAGFTRESFTPLALHVTDPGAIVVRTDSPIRSLAEMIAAAKARPDDFRMSDNGILGHEHLASIRLQRLAGVTFNQVHFNGAGPALTALLGGQTEAAIFAVGTASAQMRQGAVRAIAVLSPQESPFLPGVPTARSQGYDIVAGSTRAFVGPAGLPPDVQARLAGALERAIRSPEHEERMRQLNIPITFQGPDGFAAYWAQEERELRPLIEGLARAGQTQ